MGSAIWMESHLNFIAKRSVKSMCVCALVDLWAHGAHSIETEAECNISGYTGHYIVIY